MHSPDTPDQAPRTTRKGPRSAEGRKRCAEAKTVHGRETRAIRELRSLISYQLRCKEAEMFEEGYLVRPRTRGRKPALYRRLIQSESLNTGERVPWGGIPKLDRVALTRVGVKQAPCLWEQL